MCRVLKIFVLSILACAALASSAYALPGDTDPAFNGGNLFSYAAPGSTQQAGAAIGPDLFRFYRSIGVNLKQLYGSTETCAYVCLQPDRGVKFVGVHRRERHLS